MAEDDWNDLKETQDDPVETPPDEPPPDDILTRLDSVYALLGEAAVPLSVVEGSLRPKTYRGYLEYQENRLGAHLESEIQRYTKAIADAEQTAALGRQQLELCSTQLARLAKWPEKKLLTRRKAEL